MKKIIIAACLYFLSALTYAQLPAGLTFRDTIIKKEIDLNRLDAVIATDRRCDVSFDYSSSSGWTADKHLYTLSCTSLTWLTGTQGSHAFTGGQLQLNDIQDASMNRVYRSFTPILSNYFAVDFEAKIKNPNNNYIGYFLLALTQNGNAPMQDFTTCSTIPTNNNAIIINVQNTGAGAPMMLSVISKYGTTVAVAPLAFTVQSDIVYYYRLVRKSDSKLSIQVFSDAARTALVFEKQCIDIDPRIDGLKNIQHANNPAGGYMRTINGYIDNVCIKNNDVPVCCTPRITGSNTICEERAPAIFQVNVVAGNSYQLILPAGVAGTLNQSNGQIVITSWGTITQAPQVIEIKVKMTCNCEESTATFKVYVYPVRNTVFNISGLGNNGTMLTNFTCTAPFAQAGIIHQWEMYESDAGGTALNWPNGIRNIVWQTSPGSGNTVYNVIANGTTIPGPPFPSNIQYPFKTLVTGKFYLITHGMYFESNTCDWKGSGRLIYIGTSNRLIDLGDPKAPDFNSVKKRLLSDIKQ